MGSFKAEIIISYESETVAKAVAEAVSPDNVKIPLGLYIKTENRQNNVWAYIECKKSLKTLIATLDDLLSAISIAEKTLKAAQKLE